MILEEAIEEEAVSTECGGREILGESPSMTEAVVAEEEVAVSPKKEVEIVLE